MSKILVLGGARSGKSDFAQKMAESFIGKEQKGIYLATAVATDDEMKERIERHRAKRDEKWITLEEPVEIGRILKENDAFPVILIDCLTLWLNNLFFYKPDEIDLKIEEFKEALNKSSSNVIMVSNELGMGIVPENRISREFRDRAGLLNIDIAKLSDSVYFIVAGLSLRLK